MFSCLLVHSSVSKQKTTEKTNKQSNCLKENVQNIAAQVKKAVEEESIEEETDDLAKGAK